MQLIEFLRRVVILRARDEGTLRRVLDCIFEQALEWQPSVTLAAAELVCPLPAGNGAGDR